MNTSRSTQELCSHAEVAARTGRPLSGTVELHGAGPTDGSALTDRKTYQCCGGVGLGVMAMLLARHRYSKYMTFAPNRWGVPAPKDRRLSDSLYPLSREYYRIIDRVSVGELP